MGAATGGMLLGMETHRGRRVWSPFSPLENRKALPHGHTLRHCYTCLLFPLNIWFPSISCSGPGQTETFSLSWLLTQQSRAGGSQNGKHQGLILRCLTLMNMQRPSNLRLALTLLLPGPLSRIIGLGHTQLYFLLAETWDVRTYLFKRNLGDQTEPSPSSSTSWPPYFPSHPA